MRGLAAQAALLAVLIASGCAQPPQSAAPTYQIKVGKANATVEIAATPQERALGLSNRQAIGENEGMLFVFSAPGTVSFWMKDTYVPLSIAFIDADMEVTDIQDMEPQTLDAHRSPEGVVMALEMPAGWFGRNGVALGDRVEIPREAAAIAPR